MSEPYDGRKDIESIEYYFKLHCGDGSFDGITTSDNIAAVKNGIGDFLTWQHRTFAISKKCDKIIDQSLEMYQKEHGTLNDYNPVGDTDLIEHAYEIVCEDIMQYPTDKFRSNPLYEYYNAIHHGTITHEESKFAKEVIAQYIYRHWKQRFEPKKEFDELMVDLKTACSAFVDEITALTNAENIIVQRAFEDNDRQV
jgi:hypothetical protein